MLKQALETLSPPSNQGDRDHLHSQETQFQEGLSKISLLTQIFASPDHLDQRQEIMLEGIFEECRENATSIYLDQEEKPQSLPKPPKSFSEALATNSALYNKIKGEMESNLTPRRGKKTEKEMRNCSMGCVVY